MSRYWAVARVFYKSQLIWRFDAAFGMVFTTTKMLFAYVLWGAIYAQRQEVAGFSLQAMLTYYVLSSFFSQWQSTSDASEEISRHIRGGSFSKYMVIPANVQGYFAAQFVGKSAALIGFHLIAAAAWTLLFGIRLTLTADMGLLSAGIALWLLGGVCMVQINCLLGFLAFKWGEVWLFNMIKDNIVSLIAGTMVPLALLPAGLQSALRFLPFYHAVYLPSMLFMGRGGGEALLGMCVLLAWIAFLLPFNAALYRRLRIRYDGVGI